MHDTGHTVGYCPICHNEMHAGHVCPKSALPTKGRKDEHKAGRPARTEGQRIHEGARIARQGGDI